MRVWKHGCNSVSGLHNCLEFSQLPRLFRWGYGYTKNVLNCIIFVLSSSGIGCKWRTGLNTTYKVWSYWKVNSIISSIPAWCGVLLIRIMLFWLISTQHWGSTKIAVSYVCLLFFLLFRLQALISSAPVMLFMKGTPEVSLLLKPEVIGVGNSCPRPVFVEICFFFID